MSLKLFFVYSLASFALGFNPKQLGAFPYDGPTPTCSPSTWLTYDWFFVQTQNTEVWYVVSQKSSTWEQASSACSKIETNNPNGQMSNIASIINLSEQTALQTQIQSRFSAAGSNDYFWIGGEYGSAGWIWESTDQKIVYKNWPNGASSPSNSPSDGHTSAYFSRLTGVWDNAISSDSIMARTTVPFGYICEFRC